MWHQDHSIFKEKGFIMIFTLKEMRRIRMGLDPCLICVSGGVSDPASKAAVS